MNQVHPEPQLLPAQGVPVGPLVLEASAAGAWDAAPASGQGVHARVKSRRNSSSRKYVSALIPAFVRPANLPLLQTRRPAP